MIRGFFAGESPYLSAVVSFGPGGGSGSADLLVDTGAFSTTVNSRDLDRLALDAASLFAGSRTRLAIGAGGRVMYYVVPATIELLDDARGLVVYRIEVQVPAAPSTEASRSLPSILGMDFLSAFQLTVSYREDRVELDAQF